MATNSNFKNRPSNYVILTLMAIAAGEMKISQAGSLCWLLGSSVRN